MSIFYHYKTVPSNLWNTFIPNTMKFENSDYKMSTFEIIVIPIIFLEEFVKRSLIGIYYLWQKFDYWNFNRQLPKS